MNSSRTARERVRAELTREIAEIARRHLATEGAVGLSLRAVAREMGMSSSAVYRYFPSKDDLLTTLIIDGYNALGRVVEQADAGCDRADHGGRWRAVCHAVRDWALAHPHEYALLYGSPVPGYQAPQDTVAPAMRDTIVFGRIVSEAHEAGALTVPAGPMGTGAAGVAEDMARVREQVMPGVPDAVAVRAVTAWTGVFGWIGFELFGQFNNVIEHRAALFDHSVAALGALIGLPRPVGESTA
ncbi:DNA-binding transcriptional regulator, AcrR family [Thermomonospora echinospora]|uniref:DNA-binding transcriptional regulator, AcrR family n=1 Tax=Thermomonospora echinospora TaxID=1992 RepID=A0A1H6DZC1_9ACTN|nr:TetR/AcrR family transcriptional regulator [Thermomonospora echinospora]SEG90698.1 DNA-binding transcriptional regulator, AcrR family [Thermomonospora echinospora]